MIDLIREFLSYGYLLRGMRRAERRIDPQRVNYGDDPHQYILFYEPEQVRSGTLIVWIHGGGWNSGSPASFDFVGQCIAAHGYPTVSLGYRLAPKHRYPAQIEDVCTGFKEAIAYVSQKGIDTSRIVICGPSAGAHLASLLCYDRQMQEREGIDASNLIGFVGFGGPYKFDERHSFALRMLLRQLFPQGYDRAQAEPYSLISESSIPMLLIQSEHDGIVSYANAVRFHEKAESLGIPAELYSVVDRSNTHSAYSVGIFLENR